MRKGIVVLFLLCVCLGIVPSYATETYMERVNREAIEELSQLGGYRPINASEFEALLNFQNPFVLVYFSSECGPANYPFVMHFMDQYGLEVHFFDGHLEAPPMKFWRVFIDDSDPGFRYPLIMTYDGIKAQFQDATLYNKKTQIDQYRLIASYLKVTQNVDMITDFEIYNNEVRKLERADALALEAYLTETERFPTADKKVVNFAKTLTKDLSTDEEKAQKIFLWTSSKVMQYISDIQAAYKKDPDFKAPTDDTPVDVIDKTIFGEYYYPHYLMVALLRSVGIPTKLVDYNVVQNVTFFDLFKAQAGFLAHNNNETLFEKFQSTDMGYHSNRVIIASYINGRWVMMSPDVDLISLNRPGGNLPVKAPTLDGYDLDLSVLSQQHVFNDFEDEASLRVIEVKNELEELALANPTLSPWAKKEVIQSIHELLVPEGIQSNYQNAITRAEFASLIVKFYIRAADGYARYKNYFDASFLDIEDSVYKEDIETAYGLGLVSGTNALTFDPENPVTREQVAVMFKRCVDQLGLTASNNKAVTVFADDALISDWAKEALEELYRLGILTGVGENRIDPKGITTREQAILMATRLLDLGN